MQRARHNKYSGFSLVELIAIIVLLSILSVTALSRINVNPFATASFDQEIRSAVRFAQKFALASGCNVMVDIDGAADSYAVWLQADATGAPGNCLTAVGAFTNAMPDPTGGVLAGVAPGSVDIVGNLNFVYDLEGRPSVGGSVTVDGNALTVEAVTGYVY